MPTITIVKLLIRRSNFPGIIECNKYVYLVRINRPKKVTRLSKKNLLIYYDIPERVDPVNNVHSDRRL